MAYNIAPSKQDLLVSGTNIKTINGNSLLGSGDLSISGSGVTTVGAFSGSSQTNGASISSSTITFGPADGTNPGMVSTAAQTIAGQKTLNGGIKLTATGVASVTTTTFGPNVLAPASSNPSLDFDFTNGTRPYGRIFMDTGAGGSVFKFGTSSSFATGINQAPLVFSHDSFTYTNTTGAQISAGSSGVSIGLSGNANSITGTLLNTVPGGAAFQGTNNPGFKIAGSNYYGISFNGYSKIAAYDSASGSYLYFGTSNSYASGVTNTALTIQYDGRIGVGVTAPAARLDINNTNYGSTNPTVRLTYNGTPNFSIFMDGAWNTCFSTLNTGNADGYKFYYTSTELVSITKTGNVGINVSSPVEKLEVSGNVKVTSGDVVIATAGKGLTVTSGTNAKIGVTGAFPGGNPNTVTVSTTAVTSNSIILVSAMSFTGGLTGAPYVSAITASTSFVITMPDNSFTGTVGWVIIEKA